MSDKKQSSVEWLMDKLKFVDKNSYNELYEDYEQAKAMHKEEIIDAWRNGDKDCMYFPKEEDQFSEQYYNETFGE
jgi:hypothetical protein